ncbi:MAG TPA: ATP-binding cassette domain-containing protein [Streptosporangiaceae bacterium]|nr:ATP-binding cassette domain-containing protein [Streptosporangiaceae bacterium]
MTVVLEARDITKVYGHVNALAGANFEVKAGQVTALIGDNGAGKSTLVKILSGTEAPTAGEILVDGQPVTIDGPLAARRYGIETVYQDLALAPHLNPVQNMYLGREIMRPGLLGRLGFMDNADMRVGSKKAFDELGATVRNYTGSVGAMSGGQKQAVAVARAAAWARRVILLDEPTAALGVVQTKGVLDLIRRVRDRGLGVVFISHQMPAVLEVADEVQVMRLGRRVAAFKADGTTMEELVGTMTGAVTQDEAAQQAVLHESATETQS